MILDLNFLWLAQNFKLGRSPVKMFYGFGL